MGGYDPEAELMSDRRDFRAEMTAARLEIARLQAEVERWKGIAEDTETLKQNYAAMLATARNEALEEAAQIAWDNDAKAFRGRYDVDYKGRQRWDRLQLRSAENQCMNTIAEDTANAIRALKRT